MAVSNVSGVSPEQLRGQQSYLSGQSAEMIVAREYQSRGYELVAHRWCGQSGEIDLVFRYGDAVICVEVKMSNRFSSAAQRISQRQMQRIYGAASEFIADEPKGQLTDVRFDAALVNGFGQVQVIENAFGQF